MMQKGTYDYKTRCKILSKTILVKVDNVFEHVTINQKQHTY